MENNRLAVILGVISAIAVIILSLWGISSNEKTIFMNGELSAKHSPLESECSMCHKPWQGVTWESCAECHDEKMHVQKVKGKENREGYGQLTICLNCHNEHKGRSNNLKVLSNSACETCHTFDTHPEKNQADEPVKGEGAISFTHLQHYDIGTFELDMCDYCHIPASDDETFINAKFDKACKSCHRMDEHNPKTKVTESCKLCHEDNEFKTEQGRNRHDGLTIDSHARHEKLDCNSCHRIIPPFGETAVSTNPPVSDCISCHEKKLVNNRCGTCHTFHIDANESYAGLINIVTP